MKHLDKDNSFFPHHWIKGDAPVKMYIHCGRWNRVINFLHLWPLLRLFDYKANGAIRGIHNISKERPTHVMIDDFQDN